MTSDCIEYDRLVQLPWFEDGQLICRVHRFLNLVGEPSTGKTTFAKAVAKKLSGRDPVLLPGSPEIEQVHFFGSLQMIDGDTQWSDGGLWKALKEKSWLLIEDADKIPIDSRSALLQLRGATHVTNPLNQEILPLPPADPSDLSFRIIMTSNLESLRCNRNAALARALYSDVITLEVPELTRADMKRFLKSRFPECSQRQVNDVLKVWGEYAAIATEDRNGETEHILTFRACEQLMKLQLQGMKPERALLHTIVTKYITDKDLYAVAKLKATVA